LRRPVAEDWLSVHEWGTHPEAYQYQVWGPNSERQTQEFVSELIDTWDVPDERRVRWAWVADEPNRGVIGAGELHIRSRVHRQGEITYVVHPDHWGRGYATMIGRLLLHEAFSGLSLHRVSATCDPRNLASAAVLRKLGMTYEGRLRQTLLLRDGWRDSEVFSILESEWEAV
jgi:[ribosomal protein S5]-alanine N-acetyltransferase